jgi:hypothetical protein
MIKETVAGVKSISFTFKYNNADKDGKGKLALTVLPLKTYWLSPTKEDYS